MRLPNARPRRARHLLAIALGLGIALGSVAKAGGISEILPSLLATQSAASLAVIVDQGVLEVAGAIGFMMLVAARRGR